MLNSTECCRTIGCNCAGTTSAETLATIPIWLTISIIGICSLILFIIVYIIYNKQFSGENKMKNSKVFKLEEVK